MSDHIRAPWTPEQVANLNAFQQRGGMHPFTCGGDHTGPNPSLVARPDGWHCPGTYRTTCDYRQDWAHAFMADPAAWPKMPLAAETEPSDPTQRPGETADLTAEEARDLADELGTQLYRAQDALAFVEECCVIAERESRTVTVADIRTWLKGAQCGRQLAADSGFVVDPAAPPLELATWTGPAVPRFTAHRVTPEVERAATERARQAAADSERSAAWFAATGGVIGGTEATEATDVGNKPDAPARTPPPPGSTAEQLPADILAAIRPGPYLSTACHAAYLCETTEPTEALTGWPQRLHSRCRINNKFTGALCVCPCHREEPQP